MKTTIFGHRGIPVKFVENSRTGFEYLAQKGEAVEFDVHLTKDNVPVIMHDEQLDRTTNSTGYIKNFNAIDLKNVHLINDSNRHQQLVSKHESIPTLEDVFEIFNHTDIFLNVELKTDYLSYPGIEKIVLNLLEKYDLSRRVVLSSFNIFTLQRLYQLDHTQNLAFLSSNKINKPQQFMTDNHLKALHLDRAAVSDTSALQRIWTVNSESDMNMVFKQHLDGLFTDDFEKAKLLRDDVQELQ
ncbi:glycerophosphodiester phosphodiesterase family protein [uncultured Leuconostoc sp.]|uniref:glycerophosphodiester phosphodiesterase family protein n=1 Tax=uncultured Leuconostoc sp. TaxID=173262 RepID=UPI0025D106BC|nr:glycerophosphodiester phosphodiesterase family protein [uncultured Leuconostoc sp.]